MLPPYLNAVELVSIAFLLMTELPNYKLPLRIEEKIRALVGFLYTPVGRLGYIIYLSLILYGFSTFGAVMGVVMSLATLFNVFLYLKVLSFSSFEGRPRT